jgi:hypothetical protein
MQKLSMNYLCERFGKQGGLSTICAEVLTKTVMQENSVKSISRSILLMSIALTGKSGEKHYIDCPRM